MKIVLGSQSPRRRELLQNWVGSADIAVVPPLSKDELSFDGLTEVGDIERRLLKIVRQKLDDVMTQVSSSTCVTICADTIVVVTKPEGSYQVLGKPPKDSWQPTVREWFEMFYCGKTHEVWTGFEIVSDSKQHAQIVKTSVAMPEIDRAMIEWYISTNEPIGKAGGYGIQGQASMLIEKVDGSLSNVIGLPMFEVAEALREFGVQPKVA
jgi:septum formation protein